MEAEKVDAASGICDEPSRWSYALVVEFRDGTKSKFWGAMEAKGFKDGVVHIIGHDGHEMGCVAGDTIKQIYWSSK